MGVKCGLCFFCLEGPCMRLPHDQIAKFIDHDVAGPHYSPSMLLPPSNMPLAERRARNTVKNSSRDPGGGGAKTVPMPRHRPNLALILSA